MWKTVQKEYVGIEDFLEIAENAHALMKEGHYVSVELTRLDFVFITVIIILGGFREGKGYDYHFMIPLNDEEYSVEKMHKCKSILNNLISSEEE